MNAKGLKDRLLVLHIKPEPVRLIATQNDSVFLRMGDRTREMKGEDLRMLEYSKGLRRYEDEIFHEAEMADLDKAQLSGYPPQNFRVTSSLSYNPLTTCASVVPVLA